MKYSNGYEKVIIIIVVGGVIRFIIEFNRFIIFFYLGYN